jgi:hypothetical protein
MMQDLSKMIKEKFKLLVEERVMRATKSQNMR